MKRVLIIAAAGMAFASPAWAIDWVADSNSVQGTAVIYNQQYVAIDGNGNPVTDHTLINADGSFKEDCENCKWTPSLLPPSAGQEAYKTKGVEAKDPITGNSAAATANVIVMKNTNGATTALHSGGLVTNGTVAAPTMYTNDSSGNTYHVGNTLSAHSALLSQHTAQLEEHSKGLAIAMAMPDAWLSDKKRFGIFGAVGGFEGETAIGFAAIGRLDETWSVNAKLGADTNFDHLGWQVGVGAQW